MLISFKSTRNYIVNYISDATIVNYLWHYKDGGLVLEFKSVFNRVSRPSDLWFAERFSRGAFIWALTVSKI